VKQGGIVWGCSQEPLGDGDEGDRPGYRLKIPDLILIPSINVALFVLDVTGPAVTSEARKALGVPVPSGGEKARGRIRQVGLSVVEASSLLPTVMETRGVAIAVRDLLVAFGGTRDVSKAGVMSVFEGVMLCWW
jgi:hypothetical protein